MRKFNTVGGMGNKSPGKRMIPIIINKLERLRKNIADRLVKKDMDYRTEINSTSNDKNRLLEDALNQLIIEVIFQGATDLTMDVRRDVTEIKLVKHGRPEHLTNWSVELGTELAGFIYNKVAEDMVFDGDKPMNIVSGMFSAGGSGMFSAGEIDVNLFVGSNPSLPSGFTMLVRVMRQATS